MRLIPTPFTLCVLLAVVTALLWAPGPTTSASPSPSPVTIARQHLAQLVPQGTSDGSDFALVEYRESLGGRHAHFQQTIDGLPVYGAYVTVSLDKAGENVTMVTGRSASDARAAVKTFRVASSQAVALARKSIDVRRLRATPRVQAVYYAPPTGGVPVRSWQVRLPASDPLGEWDVIVSASDGAVLHTANLMVFDHPTSSGQVFDPNPVVSSGATVPPPINCDSAPNEALLSGEYVTHTLLGINTGQGKLIGEYIDVTSPGLMGGYKVAGQADELSHVYAFPCNDDRFEEVMVYYHIDRTQRLIQSLGFTGGSAILASPMSVHAHFYSGCNAFYALTGLAFGDGTDCGLQIDWAEDADVIVHEYGHALQDAAAGGTYFQTAEGFGLGEGFADFVAAAVIGDPCMFEWLAAFGYPAFTCFPNFKDPDQGPFRDLVNTRHYPEDVNVGPHVTGLIWGGALWDIVQLFGGDEAARHKALTLSLQSNFYLNELANFGEAAGAVRQADIDLFGGADVAGIEAVFAARGITIKDPSGDTDGDTLPNPADIDDDGDGCIDVSELRVAAGTQTTGGRRNPHYVWDFMDQWIGSPSSRDRVVSAGDIASVIARYGSVGDAGGDPLTPPGATTGYHVMADRNGAIPGQNQWNLAPPDGSVSGGDIAAVVVQYGHNCV